MTKEDSRKSEEKKPKSDKKVEIKETPKVAKAGKRSEKAIKEVEEKVAKEERKKSDKEDKPKTKKPAPKTRSREERRGKKYQEASKKVDKSKDYSVVDAVKLAKDTSKTKFDATVELHIRLDVDPKQADQNIRGTVVLPAGTGKELKVAVFAEGDDVKQAKSAGADIAEGDEFLQKIDKEQIDFDVLITGPKQMAKLSKYARVLGPKGLMPNPKSGTVTTEIAKAVKEAKAGKLEYRVDSEGIIHLGIGKVSFSEKDLEENIKTIFGVIKTSKPSSVKGTFVKSVYLTTSMGPSIKVSF